MRPPSIPDHELLQPIASGAYGEVWLARNAVGTLRAVKIVRRDRHSSAESFEREFRGLQKFEPVSRTHEGLVDILTLGLLPDGAGFYYVMELADDVGSGKAEGGRQKAEDRGRKTEASGQRAEAGGRKTEAGGHLPEGGGRRAEDRGQQPESGGRKPGTGGQRPEGGSRGGKVGADIPSVSISYVPRTLCQELRKRGRLPVAECVELGLALTRALAHLHAQGLVHRDVKPSNIIYVGGVPKLADVGLVTEAVRGDDARSIVGTEGFLPPEGPGTPAADVFALGKVLYEAATGRDRREYPALPQDLRDLPDAAQLIELNAILLKACAADARQRYANAEALLVELGHLVEGRSVKRRRAWENARRFALKAAAVIAFGVASWWLLSRFNASSPQPATPPAPASVFVLPFRADGTNQVDDLLRNRMTDAIIDGLALVEGLKVGPRKWGWSQVDHDVARRLVAQQLRIRFTVSGIVRTDANELSLNLLLSDGLRPIPDAARTFRSTPPDQVKVERQAIEWVAAQLGGQISESARTGLEDLLQANRRALERVQSSPWENEYTKPGLSACLASFNEAVTVDSKFAQAHILIAAITGRFCDRQFHPRQVMTAMEREATEALRLDDTLSLAEQELGYVAAFFKRDWPAAEAHFKRAIELDPNGYWSHWNYAKFLRTTGRIQEAKVETDRAYALDRQRHSFIIAEQLYAEKRFQEAVRLVDPKNSGGENFYDGDLLFAAGRWAESITAFERTRAWDGSPEWISRLGFVHARMGHRTQARDALRELEQLSTVHPYISSYFFAVVHAGLGNTDACFSALDQAVDHQSRFVVGWGLYSLITDVVWDDIRGDPRFAALLDRVGLPPAARALALQRKLPHPDAVTLPAALPNPPSP